METLNTCTQRILGNESSKRIYLDGHVILGALFPVHHNSPLDTQRCGHVWEQYGIQRVEAFLLVLEQINNDKELLPNVILGADIRDSCWYTPKALEESKDFIRSSFFSTQSRYCDNENTTKPIAGVIGPGSSSVTEDVQNMLSQFEIPQIGYSATSITLSDTDLYPYYLRVVSPDSQQAQALADLVADFDWKYVSTVHSEGTYGSKGIQQFQTAIAEKGICVAAEAVIDGNPTDDVMDNIIQDLLENKAATVIVCFCDGNHIRILIGALKRHNLEDVFTVIGSDGWNTRQDVVQGQEPAARGSFSIQLSSPPYKPFERHYLSLDPTNHTINPWFKELWEYKFNCSFTNSSSTRYPCSGKEDLSANFDVDGKIGFVVDAIYTAAIGLNNMINHYCPDKRLCDKLMPINGTLFYEYMLRVNFTTYSRKQLYFDDNGDPPGKYQVMNYQLFPNGSYGYVHISSWEQGLGLHRNSDNMIQWKGENNTIPESVCSKECPRGYATHHQREISRCCWICEKCEDNSIISTNMTCVECDMGWWPNDNLTECVAIEIEHIQWSDVEAILPFTLAIIGMILAVGTLYVTAKNNDTAIVKASTRELSYLILAGIILTYISTIAFIVKPTVATCYVTRILPGLAFSMIYGSVLTKTNRIARILARGKKKIITRKPHCMTTTSLLLITMLLVVIELAIIIGVLIWQPVATEIIYPTPNTARLECKMTIYGILGPLGFDFLLIGFCTFYAVNTRNVPANFNEAKFIGFAMYTTCVIWIAFVPLYFSNNSKVITITICITLSATVALMLLFWPKAYIIIWKPEKNNRGAFTTTTEVRCHVGQRSFADKSMASRKYSLWFKDGYLSDIERYGLMKSKGSIDREVSGLYESDAYTTCDDLLTPTNDRLYNDVTEVCYHQTSQPDGVINNDELKRSVACQVDFDKNTCMFSQPMWEISSEESCVSHGCGYIHVDDGSSMSKPPSYRSLCRHSSLRNRTHPRLLTTDTDCVHRRCASLKNPSYPNKKTRVTRISSHDPQIHTTKQCQYVSDLSLRPPETKEHTNLHQISHSPHKHTDSIFVQADITAQILDSPPISTITIPLTTSRSNVDIAVPDDSKSKLKNTLPIIIDAGFTHRLRSPIKCICPSRRDKQSTEHQSDLTHVTGNTTPELARIGRKLYPSSESPMHKTRENGYIPISYTAAANATDYEKATPHYYHNHLLPCESTSINRNNNHNGDVLHNIKYLDESSSDDSSIEDTLAISVSKELLTTSGSSTNGEEEKAHPTMLLNQGYLSNDELNNRSLSFNSENASDV